MYLVKQIFIKRLFTFILSIIALAVCVLVAGFGTGCSDGDNISFDSYEDLGEINLAIVYANSKNSAAELDYQKLGNYMMAALVNGDSQSGTCSFTLLDGSPQVLKPNIEFQKSNKNNSQNFKDENEEVITKYLNFIKENSDAKAEQVDIVQALALACKTFPQNSTKRNVIYVSFSGLSTSGRLDFTNDTVLGLSQNEIASLKNLPDFKNCSEIVWTGFSAVPSDSEQKQIRADYPIYDRMVSVYESYVKAAGVKAEKPINWIANCYGKQDKDKSKLPYVTPVNTDPSSLFDGDWKTVVLNDTTLNFVADSSAFTNEQTANGILSDLAEKLKLTPSTKIVVNGYVAAYPKEIGNLSQKRSDHVKAVLVENGVDSSMIRSVGVGAGPYPYLVNGVVNPQNRFIEICKEA